MTDDHNYVEINQAKEASPPPPLFDANASASAQPVELIRRSRISIIIQRVRSLSSHIRGEARVLAVVIIIGLITGALGGMLLVNVVNVAESSHHPAKSVRVEDSVAEITGAEAQKLDIFAAELAGTEAQTFALPSSRTRKVRARVGTNRPRAYRVAVIR